MQYYYAQNNDRKGPVSLEELRRVGITPQTLVWHSGMASWTPAGQLPELNDLFNSPPPIGQPFSSAQQSTGYQGPGMAPPPQNQYGAANPWDQSQQAPPQYQQPSQGAGSWVYASFLRRFVALIIDGLVLSIPNYVLAILVGLTAALDAIKGETDAEVISSTIIGVYLVYLPLVTLINATYEILMIASGWQGTLGKRAMGLVVVDKNGNRLSLGSSILRYISKFVSGLICYIGYIMALFDDRKRALHDRMAETLVMKVLD